MDWRGEDSEKVEGCKEDRGRRVEHAAAREVFGVQGRFSAMLLSWAQMLWVRVANKVLGRRKEGVCTRSGCRGSSSGVDVNSSHPRARRLEKARPHAT